MVYPPQKVRETVETKKRVRSLHKLSGAPRRSLFATIDIESKDGETQDPGFTRPFMVNYYDGGIHYTTKGPDCIPKMLDFILSYNLDGVSFYAHNGGGFDWLHFLAPLVQRKLHLEIIPSGSKAMCIRAKVSKKSKRKGWRFLDSYQLIPVSLAKGTKAFDCEVQKEKDFDLAMHEDDPRWETYIRRDCESLYEMLCKFHDLIEDLGGEVGMTTAATSMRLFRRVFMEKPIQMHRLREGFFREAYYGGRVEIFRKHGKGARYYDINSAYPSAMLTPMPTGRIVHSSQGKPTAEFMKTHIGFVRANVEMPKVHIPVLPVRSADNEGKLIFPIGNFSGCWPAIELIAAEKRGAKVEWLDSVFIEATTCFAEMVEKLYPMRDKSKAGYSEGLAYVTKILLNALYGKFAMSREREKTIQIPNGEYEPPNGSLPLGEPELGLYIVKEECDAPYIIPQISAHITALARLRLLDLLEEANKKGDSLFYCDTDAAITSENLDHLCGTGLGEIKDEGEGRIYEADFLQPKLYFLKGSDGHKFASGTFEIPRWASAWEAVNGASPTYKNEDGETLTHEHKTTIPKGAKTITIPDGESLSFLEEKIAMKGYPTRTAHSFEKIRMGQQISHKSFEKIGALRKAGFQHGPKALTLVKLMRSEDTKRKHLAKGGSNAIKLNEPKWKRLVDTLEDDAGFPRYVEKFPKASIILGIWLSSNKKRKIVFTKADKTTINVSLITGNRTAKKSDCDIISLGFCLSVLFNDPVLAILNPLDAIHIAGTAVLTHDITITLSATGTLYSILAERVGPTAPLTGLNLDMIIRRLLEVKWGPEASEPAEQSEEVEL